MMTPVKTRLAVTAALGALLLAATGCGKLGTLEQAPPLFGRGAAVTPSQGPAVSQNPEGGDTATLDGTVSSRDSERAKPDKNSQPRETASDYYTENRRVQDAPLEGFGNSARVNNVNPGQQ